MRAVRQRRVWLRGGLVALMFLQLTLAGWILVSPRSFFDRPWVGMGMAYNEHLLLDFGAMNLALAVVLGAAARVMERRLTRTALLSTLVFWSVHFVVHLRYLHTMSAADDAWLMTALGLSVVAPAVLLILERRTDPLDLPSAVRNG
ncbi:MAG: hypothetical protein DLM58_01055 [Pseudonocardiales bacterium]|nr:MAG: hypothetical protein DLM58_01055 [Pseudonocardiales bacterium]